MIITIILMLNLATVTVNVVIDGGLFEYAGNSKNVTELASEEETVQKASMLAKSTSKTGRVTVANFEKTIKKMVDASNITVMANSETIALKFNKSNRYYEIDSKGKVTGPIELGTDENAGDLSKGGKYNGESDTTAFLITCIEDLVEFSKNYATYQNSYVKLTKDLDFNSIFSYNDYTSTAYGNLNGDDKTEDIKTELTKQGDDCIGFTPIEEFYGTFDGQNNKICNLYENRGEEKAGLFENNKGIIKNLGLENINLRGSINIGGIVAYSGGEILNCFTEGKNTITMINETGDTYVGLIIGVGAGSKVENCYSKGEIEINAIKCCFGGITGRITEDTVVYKCYNIMEIDTDFPSGGIIGFAMGNTKIEECYHIGNIISDEANCAGIASSAWTSTIINCYNIGAIGSEWGGGIVSGNSFVDCFNCYSVGAIQSINDWRGGIINGKNEGGHIVHCFGKRGDFGTLPEGELTEEQIIAYLSKENVLTKGHGDKIQLGYKCNVLTDDEMKAQSFVDELNILIEAGKSGETEGVINETAQTVWKMDTEGINNGYPIFTWQTKENSQ